MSFMFIFRHTVELFLKTLLYDKNKQNENIHIITKLYDLVKDLLPPDFRVKIDY